LLDINENCWRIYQSQKAFGEISPRRIRLSTFGGGRDLAILFALQKEWRRE
jgi:hypothetical protein